MIAGLLLFASCSRAPREPDPEPARLVLDPIEPVFAADGLVIERQRWQLQGGSRGAEGLAWRARVPLSGRVQVVPAEQVTAFSELLPADEGPWAAINGGFYESGPMGLVVTGGEERHAIGARGGSGVLIFGPEGARVIHREDWTPGPTEALQSIDRLIDQGASLVRKAGGNRTARSAFVVGQDALWLVALAAAESVQLQDDGATQLDRTVGHGMTLEQFADYLIQSTRPVSALNLDGAVSTQMAARFQEQRLSVRGELGTINAVVLRPDSATSEEAL